MTISQHSMDDDTEELTSFQPDSPVNLTALQENVSRLVTSVISGERPSEYWANRNPDGSWERTSQACLVLNLDDSLDEWSMTWPRWGSVWDGVCMAHPTLELVTEDAGPLSLPTPHASITDGRGESKMEHVMTHRANRIKAGKVPFSIPLHVAVLLPTPQAFDANNVPNGNKEERKKKGGCSNLSQVELPTANYRAETGERGTLNPCFVAEMMGFPITWFDIE